MPHLLFRSAFVTVLGPMLGVVLAGCGSGSAPSTPLVQPVNPTDAAVDGTSDTGELPDAPGPETVAPPTDGAVCFVEIQQHAIEGALHMGICSPLTFGTNPPSSGNHYPTWAAYRTYTQTFLPGVWVHSLEHGAVVIGYNCPGGCPAEVGRIQAFIDALPADCGTPARRVILLPNPDLDARFAASAWGFTLRADCFDEPSFATFFAQHYAHAPENICADGVDPLTAGPGGTPLCP